MPGCDVSDAADTVPPFLQPLNPANYALSMAVSWGRYSRALYTDAITRYDVFNVFTNIMTHFEALCSGMDVFQI